MAKPKSPSSTLELNVPTYITLPEAAQKHGLSEQALTQLIQAGKIEAVQLPSGEVLVSASNSPQQFKTREQIIAEKFGELIEQPITVSKASEFPNGPRSGQNPGPNWLQGTGSLGPQCPG